MAALALLHLAAAGSSAAVAAAAAGDSDGGQLERLKSDLPRLSNRQPSSGPLDSLRSLLESEELAKSGRRLPKAYIASARDVVRTLRASLEEPTGDAAAFRRGADSARGAIREYIQKWRGHVELADEESYVALEKVLRQLGAFYAKNGPSSELPQELKDEVLTELTLANAAL
eukprot:SM000139S00107  [mRNA]  locus=s139:105030:106087:- [translate_table: standard]